MSQSITLRARGLYTFQNPLSEIPEGALSAADNVVIDREGTISPRRGFQVYGDSLGTSISRSKQLLTYKGRIFRHWSSTLDYDSNGSGTFTTLSSSINEVESGTRIKYVESNGNFYFTTSSGIKKLSASSAAGIASAQVTSSGVVKAVDGVGVLNSTTGFFTQDSQVAYRIVWGIQDANTNVILGAPSQRIIVINSLLTLLIKDFNRLLDQLDTASAADGGDSLSDTDYASTLKISLDSSAETLLNALKLLADGLTNKLDTDLGGTTFQSITAPATPSNPATTAQLEAIQTYFDNIVTALNSHAGISVTALTAIGGGFDISTTSATVDLTFTVPADITSAHFYQIYRSAVASSSGVSTLTDISPDDELRLIYEDNPTAGEITARSITFSDNIPDDFRNGGANLYTNANSGEGILQANEVPPLALDIALFKGSTFFANTKTKHKKQLSLLSATGLAGNTFTIGQGVSTTTYTFVNKVAQVVTINCVSGALLTGAGTGDYFDIYSAENSIHYRFWYNVSGGNTAPSGVGVTLVEIPVLAGDTSSQIATKTADIIHPLDAFTASPSTSTVTVTNEAVGYTSAPTENVTDVGFTISVSTLGTGEDAANKKIAVSDAATPAQLVDETAQSLIRVVNKQSSEVVYGYYLSGVDDVPGLMLFEARTLSDTPFYFQTSAPISTKFNPSLPSSGTSVSSDNEVVPNRLYFSKYQQPEAVPLVNYVDVGPKDKKIIRILPLRDSLFILTEGGVYRLSGDSTLNFQVFLFDSSTVIEAQDSAVVLNNQIYMFSNQGIATISDTGVSVVSRPIENQLIPISILSNFAQHTFAVTYEADRSYLLWTIASASDTVATRCFRYNTFTNTWVEWDIAKTCGVVIPEDGKLYLGASDINYIERERKNFNRLDHADRDYDLNVPLNGVSGTSVLLGSLFGAEVGDVLIQTQYLTVSQLNRLLNKLDSDSGVIDADYYSSLQASAGSNLRSILTSLASKLDADTGVVDTNYSTTISLYTSSFSDTQLAFNAIVNKLNADTGVSFSNYSLSYGTVNYETTIEAVDEDLFVITTDYAAPYVEGPIKLYKKISSTATWAPHHFGDASITKQVRESTILFEAMTFTRAMAAYASDLSPGFKEIDFSGEGTGVWGNFSWGQVSWGGDGTSRPLRTLIPQDKQRCRYLKAQFSHARALQSYAVLGVSFTFEVMSSRGYR